ncbi:cation diffusion facilitator family transporter [Anaerococcus degeneri]|uniref:Cation diffusion facilitator family transporter n=1 Tax=Anaerococcus degeneri TaxID=361500 RepID=A0ABS7YZN3_9FIRM|nr:cation diffusion facilitator family transporter [Anaerococcus degeneri]MBP2014904.1 cation diffusion facilitator family transporter [Anaerococcus degeneri]MCA2097113.1 cation diffusion facilitator family transporter [Anaerococcus degeneri]
MFDFLANRFVKDHENIDNPDVRLNLISLSSIMGIVMNIILFLSKIFLGIFTKSTAILNDAFNNLSDSVVSIMSLVGSSFSKKPADEEHPFGHGRVEYVMALLVSIVIVYVGINLFINSAKSFDDQNPNGLSLLSFIILFSGILIKVYIYYLNSRLYKELESDLNLGVMLDARNDIISTTAIILGVFLQRFVTFNLDAAMGVVVAFFVTKPGIDLFNETVGYLLGERIDKEIEKKISEILLSGSYIIGFHHLDIHQYGKGHIAGSCHVEVPGNLTVAELHREIDSIEKKVRKETGVILTLHADPTYNILDKEG